MRSQRLIACLQLLQGERRLSARYLSEQLEVSMRTIYRDVDALCEAGVPIHMERGSQGGIVLADGYRRALAQFTNHELESLFAAGPGPLADLGLGSNREALRKLAGALPTQQRQAATTTRERLLLDNNRWGRGEQPTQLLTQLRRAIDDRRSVRLEYRDRSRSVTKRHIDLLGLVAKAGVWYVIAREAEKGYRTFRAERIVAVESLMQTFVRPVDFDLETYWNVSVASIEQGSETGYPVVIQIEASALERLHLFWKFSISAREADMVTLQIAFPTCEAAVVELLSLHGVRAILSPPGLIEAVVSYAEAVVQRYRNLAVAEGYA